MFFIRDYWQGKYTVIAKYYDQIYQIQSIMGKRNIPSGFTPASPELWLSKYA